jgi:K+-transporting ATPase c subunit
MSTNVIIEAKKVKEWVGEFTEEKLIEILGDPDVNKDLKEEVKKRLKKSFAEEDKGIKGIQASKVAEKLGLKW